MGKIEVEHRGVLSSSLRKSDYTNEMDIGEIARRRQHEIRMNLEKTKSIAGHIKK